MSEHPADVAHHGFCRHAAERDNLGDALPPVTAGDVFDHLIPPVHAEIHVKIGQGYPFGIQEPLKQQFMVHGVKIGNAQYVSHQGTATGAASRSYRYPLLFRPTDEISHDEKISRETHTGYHVKLVIETPAVLFRIDAVGRRPPVFNQLFQTGVCLPAQPAGLVEFFRNRKLRQVVIPEFQFQVAANGDVFTVPQRFRQVMEQLLHLFRRFQVLFITVVARAFGVIERITVMDADPGFMGGKIFRRQEPYVIGGYHGYIEFRRQRQGFINMNVFSRSSCTL